MTATVRHRARPTAASSDQGRAKGIDRNLSIKSDDNEHIRIFREYSQPKSIVDPFTQQYGQFGPGTSLSVMEPPYSFYALMRMPIENSVLNQCIEAMVTNVHGHGFRMEFVGEEDGDGSADEPGAEGTEGPNSPGGPGTDTPAAPVDTPVRNKAAGDKVAKTGESSPASKAEHRTLENLLKFPNDEYTLQELRDRVGRDFETLGNAYIEVGRDARGRVVMMNHLPAHSMRLTAREGESTPVKIVLPRDGKQSKTTVRKRFRRFVQMIGAQRVYFKEFSDPRSISPVTGLVDTAISMADSATEVIHLSTYNPNSPYGLPRWFNQIRTILGINQAEMVNLDFFKDNAIPAMALMVSGGSVTQGTLDQVETHFTSGRGRSSMNRIMIVEATGDLAAADNDGKIPPPRVEMKALQGERQADATWQAYDKAGMDKIRSAFRLPPLFIGRSEEMTYATARTAYDVAEGQVFAPERQKFDDMINLKILSAYNPKFWSFRSNPPRLSDKSELVTALEAFDRLGALTPNVAIGLANEMFDLDIDKIEETWGDYPMAIVTQLTTAGKYKFENLQNAEPPAPAAPGAGMVDPETGEPVPVGTPGAKPAPGASGGQKPPFGGKQVAGQGKDPNNADEVGSTSIPMGAQKADTQTAVRSAMFDLVDTLRRVRDDA